MPTTATTSILFCNNDGDKTTDGVLVTLAYDPSERTRRSLKRLGLFWLASVASIPIVLAHFVLVPGFFIAGIVMSISVYKLETALDHAQGQCPICNETVTIKLEPKDQLPKWTYCPQCNNSLHLKLPPSTPG